MNIYEMFNFYYLLENRSHWILTKLFLLPANIFLSSDTQTQPTRNDLDPFYYNYNICNKVYNILGILS